MKWMMILPLLAILSLQEVQPERVNGGWSPWTPLRGDCSKPCGGGSRQIARICDTPTPQEGGLLCWKPNATVNEDQRARIELYDKPCNMHSCFDGSWSNWSSCEECEYVTEFRITLCGGQNCTANQLKVDERICNRWNVSTCPDPCDGDVDCPKYSICKNISTVEKPLTTCVCTMGYSLNERDQCELPPPTTKAPRPTPTLPQKQKKIATGMSKTASSLLIIFVSITLVLFVLLRVFTTDRIIQMNMELALLLAHCFLLFPSSTVDNPDFCKAVSIAIHYFFTACFIFITLEALHMYSLVAQVVKKGGFFTWAQNMTIGWGLSAIIVLLSICFEFDHYGGSYHCWLQVDTDLFLAQIIPVMFFSIVTLTLIEGAGTADTYEPLKGIDGDDLTSAKFSQRTNLVILPLAIAHWILGIFSEYEQSLPLYGIFSVLNGVLGFSVLFFHSFNNAKVRNAIKNCLLGHRKKETSQCNID